MAQQQDYKEIALNKFFLPREQLITRVIQSIRVTFPNQWMINFVRPQPYLEVIYGPDLRGSYSPLTTFNTNLLDLGRIIRKHLAILESNPKLKELFPPNSIPSFRRSKNLKELLAPSRYGPNTKREEAVEVEGCFKCERTRFDFCRNFLLESNTFQSFQTGKSYKIRSRLSCDSKNIIYLASCKKCCLQYIGSTTTDCRVRFCNHKSAMITKKKTCKVAVHFNKTQHDLSDFWFQCIDQVQMTVNNSIPQVTSKNF